MNSVKSTKVKNLMTRGPVTLKRKDVLNLADDVMELGRIRHIPIMENDQVVGVLSQRDLFRHGLAKVRGLQNRERKELLKAIRIEEIMRKPVITINSEASLKDAAQLMVQKKIGCLPVVEGGRLVGLITETDVLRFVSEQ